MFHCSSQQQNIMDFTCLYIRLLIVLLPILMPRSNSCVFAQKDDEDFPRINPDKLQFFRYEAVDISCEHLTGLTEWRVMPKFEKINGTLSSTCSSPAPTCTINPAFEWHSGEYWCENTEGNTSGKINISVTAGSVILEVSPRPVLEGNEATLHCKNKDSQSKRIADFYKDGVHLQRTYESKHTIQNFSKSDEGLYKCKTSGAGESPESWITVSKMVHESSTFHPSLRNTSDLPLLLMVVGISAMILLLMLTGLLLCRKQKVSGEDSDGDPQHPTYAAVQTNRKNKGGDNKVESKELTYATVQYQRGNKEMNKPREETKSSVSEENIIYSSIQGHAQKTRGRRT